MLHSVLCHSCNKCVALGNTQLVENIFLTATHDLLCKGMWITNMQS